MDWSPKIDETFRKLKEALLKFLALVPPDICKPFHLNVDENKGIVKGVLT